MKNQWIIPEPDLALQSSLATGLDVSPVTAQILINRGIRDTMSGAAFLTPQLAQLHDPWLLKGMHRAVEVVREAIHDQRRIMIWGDYDADGVTGCAVLVAALRDVGANVVHHLPTRSEGYGLNTVAVELCREAGAEVLITTDTGVTAVEAITALEADGVQVIITDHHQPPDPLPPATAIINAWQPGCPYPFKELTGAGTAFKLVQALLEADDAGWSRYLDLAALGTVTDVGPLVGENRTIVVYGLQAFREGHRPGLQALCEIAEINPNNVTARNIAFHLGPRINACGRMGSPQAACDLLLTTSVPEARALAVVLDEQNQKRRQVQQAVSRQAIAKIENRTHFGKTQAIVVFQDGWHHGVLGIVAAQLTRRYSRPALVIGFQDGDGRGSGRSIPGFHLYKALHRCHEYLEAYGGHRQAVGFSIREDQVEVFAEAFQQTVQEMLAEEECAPQLNIEMELSLDSLGLDAVRELTRLQPFGEGNPKPLVVARNLAISGEVREVGKRGQAAYVTDGTGTCEVVDWTGALGLSKCGPHTTFDVACTPSVRTWNGQESVSLRLKELRISDHG